MQYKRGGHIHSGIVELFRECSHKKRRRSAAYRGGTPFLRFDYPSDVIALLESSLVMLEADESLLGASPERIFYILPLTHQGTSQMLDYLWQLKLRRQSPLQAYVVLRITFTI